MREESSTRVNIDPYSEELDLAQHNEKVIPWLRWTGEFVVIVLGILGALAVDEYQDQRGERELEQEYLSGFQLDLQRDSNSLQRRQHQIERTLRLTEQLLLQAGGDLSGHWHSLKNFEPTTLQLDFEPSETRFLAAPAGFTAYRATYTAIVSNGDLHILQSRDLKNALIDYYESEFRSNADNQSLMKGSRRLADFLIASGIDVYNPDDSQAISKLDGIIPYLSSSRDSEHWRLARLQRLQDRYEDAAEKLANELNKLE